MALGSSHLRSFLRKYKLLVQFTRPSSYQSSLQHEDVGDDEVTAEYTVTKDPYDWKFVERVLPPKTVPEPIKRDLYPSGWKPQGDNLKDSKYYIERTKNHMIPVYLKVEQRGQRRHTILRKIQGDIFGLEAELKEFLQKESFRPIRSQVNEFCGYIRINGDYVNAIKYWLEKRNL